MSDRAYVHIMYRVHSSVRADIRNNICRVVRFNIYTNLVIPIQSQVYNRAWMAMPTWQSRIIGL